MVTTAWIVIMTAWAIPLDPGNFRKVMTVIYSHVALCGCLCSWSGACLRSLCWVPDGPILHLHCCLCSWWNTIAWIASVWEKPKETKYVLGEEGCIWKKFLPVFSHQEKSFLLTSIPILTQPPAFLVCGYKISAGLALCCISRDLNKLGEFL